MVTIYDEVRYPNPPFPVTQPARLGVAAALFGRDYAPPEACRVLEIGCGDGGNLIPMAAAWPGAQFYGIDLAAQVIETGRAAVAGLGLDNIRLDALDLTQAGDIGQFDYVIAHGLYAWVPAAVRESLMALIGRVLSPRGVAHVSYNTLPGCRIRQAVRDMLTVLLEGVETPADRMAAIPGFLKLLSESYQDDDWLGARAAGRQAKRMLDQAPETTFHDELSPDYAPVMVRDFIAHAGRHGLQFLCEAEAQRVQPFVPKSDAARILMGRAGDDVVRLEQYADILNMESFRHSLLCRGEGPVERRFETSALAKLHLAADLKPDGDDGFTGPLGSSLKVHDPGGRALFERLGEAWPSTIPLAEVDPGVYPQILKLHLAGVAELHAGARAVVTRPGERPRLWPVARAQIDAGRQRLTTRTHETLTVTDAEGLHFIALLDGRRTREDIVAAMAERVGSAEPVRATLDQHLERLARAGLLDA